MAHIDTLIDQHYGFGQIMEKIETGLQLAGKDIGALTVDDLAPIDAFHTRGRESTLELAQLANIQATDLVLDVGCGLGGTARHLAHQYNCHVKGIDLTREYIAVGKKLTEMVGLNDHVVLTEGSALDIPYDDDQFDIVWTEHVQMNIADKNGFYGEIARVLKPGGRLLFHDIFRGLGEAPRYPTPWAQDEILSSLATEKEARAAIESAGLTIDRWAEKDADSLAFFKTVTDRIPADGPPPIGIHLLMSDNAKEKLNNYITNLSENRVAVALGVARKK